MKEGPPVEPIEPAGYDPNFVFGGNRVISEANWTEYEAQGVVNVVEAIPEDHATALRDELRDRSDDYGPANILLGDAFDRDAGRPLQHKPGVGLYATAAGREHFQKRYGKDPLQPPVLIVGGKRYVARKGESIRLDQDDARTDEGGDS